MKRPDVLRSAASAQCRPRCQPGNTTGVRSGPLVKIARIAGDQQDRCEARLAHRSVALLPGLQSVSLENWNFPIESRRLSRVLAAKARQVVPWRLSDFKEARIWQAFLEPKKDIL